MPITNVKLSKNVTIPHPELVNLYNCTIGDNTKIAAFVEISGSEIGKNCKIQSFVYIPPHIKIEDNVFIGPNVTFLNDKYPPSKGRWKSEKKTLVMQYATIGGNATILPGISIGPFCIIGAGAVVTKDVPAKAIVYGNPAKIRGI